MHTLANRVTPDLGELLDVCAAAHGSSLEGDHVMLVLRRVTACSGMCTGLNDAEGGEGSGVITVVVSGCGCGGGVIGSGYVKSLGGLGRDGFWGFGSVRDVSGIGSASGEVEGV